MTEPSFYVPSRLSPQACKRCSINKKKCDRRMPRCTSCVNSNVPCEAPTRSGDKKLMLQVEDLRKENLDLKREIAALQAELQERNAAVEALHPPPSARDAVVLSVDIPIPCWAPNDHSVLFPQTRHQSLLSFVFNHFDLQHPDVVDNALLTFPFPKNSLANVDANDLPDVEETRSVVRALLESTKHGPSNLDKIISLSQLEDDCHAVYGPEGLTLPELAGSRFRCFISVYIAMCMAAAVDGDDVTQNSKARACRFFGMREAAHMTANEDITCVEALTLLCELSIHAPDGPNLWQLVGLATRTALAIHLHRRDDIYLPTIYPQWPVSIGNHSVIFKTNQRRKDLFWSLYSIERLTVFVLNRPTVLRDEDIDVEMPPATMWPEGKYSTASSEALWVHHLQARRLYGRIHESLHVGTKTPEGQDVAHLETAVAKYMEQVQQWYMRSRFNATVIPFSEESVKRHVLDDVQYHQMVMSLHQPSSRIPSISPASISTLTRSASLSINLFHHSASRKQMNIHWVNIYHVFTACAILIYCFSEHQVRMELTALPRSEVSAMVVRCKEVIGLFRGVGPVVHKYSALLEDLIIAFESRQSNESTCIDLSPSPSVSSTSLGDPLVHSSLQFNRDEESSRITSEGRTDMSESLQPYLAHLHPMI